MNVEREPSAPSGGGGKPELRRRLAAARAALGPAERQAAGRANADHLLTALAGARVVCSYLPLPSEPLDGALLDELTAAGTSVLVPVVRADSPLDWCRYPSPTSPGAFGIAEPTGLRLGPEAIAAADVVLVPALAVDRVGRRLGRGGGHYDRSLALIGDRTPQLIAVMYDGELLDDLPGEAHDVPVTATVTPSRGVHRLLAG